MAETQAKSGTTGTSIDPKELDALSEDNAGSESAVDHTAVGRASVPGDAPAATERSTTAVDEKADGASPSTDRSASGTGKSAREQADTTVAVSTAGMPTERRTAPVVSRGSAQAGVTVRKAPPTRTTGTAAPPSSTPDPAQNTGAARVAEAVRSARATVSSAASRGPRRARLFVKRIDPWSVMKFSFAVSFVLFFVLVVATSVLYLTLDQMNVFTSVNKALAQIFGSKENIKVTATAVIGAAGAIGLVLVVLCTALSTLGAFIYNVCADLVGGIEVTLSEKE